MGNMPDRIWITMEDRGASWAGAFRRWHASDLEHEGEEYPVYVRSDVAEADAAMLAAIKKVRDGYADQARFADVDPASYFREFVRRIDDALRPPIAPQ